MRGYQPPLALCANPHGPRDPTQSVCRSRIATRMDSGALTRTTAATASMEILIKALQIRFGQHVDVLLTILDNEFRRRTGCLSEEFAVGSRGLSG